MRKPVCYAFVALLLNYTYVEIHCIETTDNGNMWTIVEYSKKCVLLSFCVCTYVRIRNKIIPGTDSTRIDYVGEVMLQTVLNRYILVISESIAYERKAHKISAVRKTRPLN